MSQETLYQNKEFSLPAHAKWGIATTNSFENYLIKYQKLPKYKKLLHSMIKFSKMYRPISKGSLHVDLGNIIKSINKNRELTRAKIYMNNRDLITTRDTTHGKKIIVTSKGHKIFYNDYPLAKMRKEKWDGTWAVIVYDFPEKLRSTRNYLRKKLTEMGFGKPQISVLISPLPLEEPILKLLEEKNLKKYVWVLTCKGAWGLTNKKIAEKAWPVKHLNHLYEKLLKALPTAKNGGPRLTTEWKQFFLALNTEDPHLPFELLPDNWKGETCKQKFLTL